MPRGDRRPAHREPFVEARLFHQPRRSELHHPLARGILRNLFRPAAGHGCNPRQGYRRNYRILEEGACTPSVWPALSHQHSLLLANRPHRLINLAERRLLAAFQLRREVAPEIGVPQSGLSPRPQLIGHRAHDILPTSLRVEETSPIAEPAGLVIQINEGARLEIIGAHLHKGLGNLLPAGPDALHWRAAHTP